MSDFNKDINNKDANNIEDNKPIALDDKKRIKVLSPGMLVFKRFIRNKLAIIGAFILVFMFAFAFLGGLLSPYGEKEVFHKYDYQLSDYAIAEHRVEFQNIILNNTEVHYGVSAMINSYIAQFSEGQAIMSIPDASGKAEYILNKLGDNCYRLDQYKISEVAVYSNISKDFLRITPEYNDDDFRNVAKINIENQETIFEYMGMDFKIVRLSKEVRVNLVANPQEAILATTIVFDSAGDYIATTEFKIAALKSLYNTKKFTYQDINYRIEGDEDLYSIYNDDSDALYMNMSRFVVRRQNGEDSLPISYKQALQNIIIGMEDKSLLETDFYYTIEVADEETEEVRTEETHFKVYRKNNNFTIKTEQLKYLIDIYAPPSLAHWFGTDSNGMDVLTRMMYGGRISLMIGFIVILIEVVLGTILGGIAGYFGKWIDNIIMRLVDIFNCIPFLPVMLIIGAVFDMLQMAAFTRIIWMMVIMGILGWSSIARLVRGQILSLREQEFMIAAEATGLSAGRRIFRHLVPNVMPQLIVNATMGLGGVILMESTLSFLGLGAKYPMATWGAMINNVSNASDLINYTYIWIPVGLLICLTVIAFNFVGDGLRDAFDPKMKR